MRNQRNVSRRHRVVAQLVGADPGEVLALARDHLAVPATADVKRHQQMKRLVSMARKRQRREAGFLHGDADFLVQFADQRRFRPLARLNLAAGEFPQACERLSLRPLRDQHALVVVDQRAGDHEDYFDMSHAPNVWGAGLGETSKPFMVVLLFPLAAPCKWQPGAPPGYIRSKQVGFYNAFEQSI